MNRYPDLALPAASRSSMVTSPKITFSMVIILAIVATVPMYRFITGLGMPFLPLMVLIAFVMLAVGGYSKWSRGGIILPASAVLVIFASLLSGMETSISSTLRVGVPLALTLILVPVVLSHYIRNRPGFGPLAVQVFLAVQTLSALAGLLQLIGINVAARQFRGRASGLADHPNVLGLMSAVSILICLAMILGGSAKRKLTWLCLSINVGALVATGSLSSMLSLVAGLLLLLVSMRGLLSKIAPLLISVVFATSVAYFVGFNALRLIEPVLNRVDVVTGNADGVASLSIRQSTYDHALSSIPIHLLTGVGMDSANEGTFNGVTVVHNYLLRGFYQGGLFLFISFMLITIYVSYLVVSTLRKGVNVTPGAIAVATLVYGMTSAFYDQQQYWLLLLGAIAFQRELLLTEDEGLKV